LNVFSPSNNRKVSRSSTASPNTSFEDRLVAKIQKTKKTLKEAIIEGNARESIRESVNQWVKRAKDACRYVGYQLNVESPLVTEDFCFAITDVWSDWQAKLESGTILPSAFCAKVIDSCRDNNATPWPPSFTQHRNRLRESEKAGVLEFYRDRNAEGEKVYAGVVVESILDLKS